MAVPTIDIERVVREVLAEMGYLPSQAPAAKEGVQHDAGGVAPAVAQAAPAAPVDGQLVIGSRLVTVADLAERLQGVRSVVVPPQAVVTPSARELLRSRNVSLAYGQAQGASPAHRVRLVLMATGSKSDPAALVRLLAGEQVEVRPEQSDCLIAATDRLAEALGDGNTLGALVTTYTAAGLCLANRHPGVRAVLGHDAASVGADAASVGANLLVVSPAPGLFRMKRIIVEFCREGPRRCPEVFRKRLG